MSKSVNIDGKEYIIESCECCPFYDDGDGGYGCHCQYPISPSATVGTDFNSWGEIAEDCPLKESSQNELKPCPFCGSSNVHLLKSGISVDVRCLDCGCRTGMYLISDWGTDGREKAIDRWNRRVENVSI